MPSYDSSRARFRLADRHIAVLAHLVDGETPPAELTESMGELQRVGLVGEEGELAPVLRELLGTLANPLTMVQIEITGEHGPVDHGIVVGPEAVVSFDSWPGEDEAEYVPVEPGMLVWELSRKINLRRAEPDVELPEVTRIETTMGTLDAVFVALNEAAAGGATGGDTEIRDLTRRAATGVDPALTGPALEQFLELVLALNSTWRVTTVWDGRHEGERATMVRALAAWDCGPLGYWIREAPEEPIMPGQVTPESTLRVVRSTPGEIWDKLVDLLPDKEDLYLEG
ncbi:hypothetical protein ACIPYQ_05565 [Streptomyces sp. NPDC090045]|uniref:hypothetical protein n=1 Tax=Streptomyces sp. NPDC090045 TaxID=3365927 RepID=UPI003809155E